MLDGKLVCSNRDLRPVYPSAKAIGLGYSGRCSCVPVISTSGDGEALREDAFTNFPDYYFAVITYGYEKPLFVRETVGFSLPASLGMLACTERNVNSFHKVVYFTHISKDCEILSVTEFLELFLERNNSKLPIKEYSRFLYEELEREAQILTTSYLRMLNARLKEFLKK
jgi:hypothetical protein